MSHNHLDPLARMIQANAARIEKSKHIFYGCKDPEKLVGQLIDGWKFEPYDTLFLIGMGLGYLPIEAIKSDIGKPRIIIIEPSNQIFHDALQSNDLKILLSNERVDLFVGDIASLSDIVTRFKERISIGKSPIIVHPNYDAIFGETIQSLKKDLSENIREAKDTYHTVNVYGKRMFQNTIANLPSLFAGTPMRKLKGKLKGIPAICVAAGPSLDDALADLKKVNNRALIIACDSAVNALFYADIKPHIVVTVDYLESNIDKLKPYMEHLCESLLVFGLESNPDNVRLFLGPRRVGVTAFSKLMSFWLDPQLKLEGLFPNMTSVSHMALFSALAMEAEPIVLVGMDLAFLQGKSHSSSSPYFHSLDKKKTVRVYGNKGCTLSSIQHFVNDRLLIESVIEKKKKRFVNTCIDGAYIDGTTIKRLAEIMAVNSVKNVNLSSVFESIDWTCAADESTSISKLNVFIRLLDDVRIECNQRKRKIVDEIQKDKSCSDSKKDLIYCLSTEKEFNAFENKNLVYKKYGIRDHAYGFC